MYWSILSNLNIQQQFERIFKLWGMFIFLYWRICKSLWTLNIKINIKCNERLPFGTIKILLHGNLFSFRLEWQLVAILGNVCYCFQKEKNTLYLIFAAEQLDISILSVCLSNYSFPQHHLFLQQSYWVIIRECLLWS